MPNDENKHKHKLSDDELNDLAGGAYYQTREKKSGLLGKLGFKEDVYHVLDENTGKEIKSFKSEKDAIEFDRKRGGHGQLKGNELENYLYAKKNGLL